MLTAVPWSELAKTAQRIVHRHSAGQWLGLGTVEPRWLPVNYYLASNFKFATIVARRRDLADFLVSSGELRIASGDEILLLNFRPRTAVVLTGALKSTVSLPHSSDYCLGTDRAGLEPVLIFGFVDSVELQVPSHAIDVIASLRRWQDPRAGFSFGFN